MANRDHSLDHKIVKAAYEEFLTYGFQKASLHKIAEKAGVTTGAIYTRYKNKDTLFFSLLQDFLKEMQDIFAPCISAYEEARQCGTTEALLQAIHFEERTYLRLLSEHYDDCKLFFCCSDGSSVETMVKEMMTRKTEETVEFFRQIYGKAPNTDALRLLMGSQFWYFRQLLSEHPEEEKMFACLEVILDFTNAGWQQLCSTFS